jgi:hypothetical protein
MRRKTCLNCRYYSTNCGEEVGRIGLDFCFWHQKPLHAAYFNRRTFTCVEEIAESCPFYEKKIKT